MWAVGIILYYTLRHNLSSYGKLRTLFTQASNVSSLGGYLNIAVMFLNGWKMPVKGMSISNDLLHAPMTKRTIFPIFADFFKVGNATFSIGDALIVIGSTTMLVLIIIWIIVELKGKHIKPISYEVRF